jgi:hypothetical protein
VAVEAIVVAVLLGRLEFGDGHLGVSITLDQQDTTRQWWLQKKSFPSEEEEEETRSPRDDTHIIK